MSLGARQDGLSISEFAHLLGFSHSTISRVYTQWTEKKGAAVLSGCLMPEVRAEPGCCWKEGKGNSNNNLLQSSYEDHNHYILQQLEITSCATTVG